MKSITIVLTTTALLGAVQFGNAQQVEVANKQNETGIVDSKIVNDVSSTFFGMFDSSKWHDGAGHVKPGEMIEFDPVDPKSWAKIVSPKTHTRVHMTITNPQFYAKFMTPGYYAKFMEPKTWFSYMDPTTYQPLLKVVSDPKTATYWMQPGAYMHGMNPSAYTQLVNPQSYAKLTTKVVEEYSPEVTNTTANMFNPFSWMKQFADAASTINLSEDKKTQ